VATPFENFVNNELPNRLIFLKGNGAPTIFAPKYTIYVDLLTDDKYEQRGGSPSIPFNDWVLIEESGNPVIADVDAIIEELDCLASLNVGDLVYDSTSIDNGVDKVTSNSLARIVTGVCIEKTSSTTAKILKEGRISGFSALTKGKPVFLGTDGLPTTTYPTTGVRQVLGSSSATGTLYFNPQYDIVIRS
jgi:hypothetical protein